MVVYTAWTLLTQYGSDTDVTRLVDEQAFYLIPRLNPDGAEIVQTLPFYEWIGNGRYLPGEEQFGAGLHYEDMNGDGIIVDMRVQDDAGEWKISERDPRLMLPRDPDEYGGTYYRVIPEGRLVDWDGGEIVVPRPQDGNLNRNYPANWVPESQQYGSGEYPGSEPETAALIRWIIDHPNIAGMQSYHTHSGVILRPWMTEPDTAFKGNDKTLYIDMGEMGAAETGYPVISIYEDFTPDKTLKRFGSFMDWTFGALGIPTFSTELWDVFGAAGIVREDFYPLRGFGEDDWLKLLQWQDEYLDGTGFLPWTPFEHPQLGSVEIGGWNRMFTFRNPPPAPYLEEMARTNCRFTLRHAAAAPKLRVRDAEAVTLGDNRVLVRAVVDNTGFLPSNLSAQAVHMRAAPPVLATLSADAPLTFVEGTQPSRSGICPDVVDVVPIRGFMTGTAAPPLYAGSSRSPPAPRRWRSPQAALALDAPAPLSPLAPPQLARSEHDSIYTAPHRRAWHRPLSPARARHSGSHGGRQPRWRAAARPQQCYVGVRLLSHPQRATAGCMDTDEWRPGAVRAVSGKRTGTG